MVVGNLRNYLDDNNLKDNTILWYCGDNGTPPSAARTGMTIRSQKGSLYEGGGLVPGVMEWPEGMKEPSTVQANAVTSDFLPTFAELVEQPLPDRPIDGISLMPFIMDPVRKREEPIFFWKFEYNKVFEKSAEPYIHPELQEGTTPLVKMMAGKYTRTFRNYKYTNVSESDFPGERTVTSDLYKLVVEGSSPNDNGFELYDLINDRAEKVNLADSLPDIVNEMKKELTTWQESVLHSLTGADYR